ncbi:uncharacterized protein LOC127861609 isoform X2 [Dreissena polymorpha]|nr:uncharacterized protein LOC127861609 isoform X2 [Dreissena polymorpha]
MLIPLTFDCNMTLLNKAYARKRIKGNEEMLLCRYSHVYATNGLRLPLANCSTGFSSPCYVPIPDGTRLEVTYVKNSTEVNMFATDSNNVYYKITEENVHKLEAKNTKSTMSLQELVVSSQLPRAVQFQQIEESDIATSDMGCRNKIVKYLRGLVKVKRVEEYELIVAWRHKGISHKYSIDVMLIPNEMAKNLVVKPYCFKTTESSKAFIAKHFDNCSWDNCVGKQLYEYQRTDSEVSIIGVLNVTVSSSNVNKYTGMLSREEQAKNRDLAQRNKDDNRNAKDQVRRQEIPKMSDERAEGCAKYTCNSSDEGIGVRFDLAETSLNDYEEIGEYVVLKNDKEMVIHKQEREHEANAIIDEDESNLYDEISI